MEEGMYADARKFGIMCCYVDVNRLKYEIALD